MKCNNTTPFLLNNYLLKCAQRMLDAHSVPLSAGGLNFQPKFSKRGDLKGSLLLEGGCWERGGDIFLRGGGGGV